MCLCIFYVFHQNLNQNPRTLLPKFFGLYCVQCGGKNIRVVVMNNILPRSVRMHLKFDLKGSTYKRRASKKEREKSKPTFKDLDFLSDIPEGLTLDLDTYGALVKTLQRDCLVRTQSRTCLGCVPEISPPLTCVSFLPGSGKFQDHGLQFAARHPQQNASWARAPVPGLTCRRRQWWKEACGSEGLVLYGHGVDPGRLHMPRNSRPRRHVRLRLTLLALINIYCL